MTQTKKFLKKCSTKFIQALQKLILYMMNKVNQ